MKFEHISFPDNFSNFPQKIGKLLERQNKCHQLTLMIGVMDGETTEENVEERLRLLMHELHCYRKTSLNVRCKPNCKSCDTILEKRNATENTKIS